MLLAAGSAGVTERYLAKAITYFRGDRNIGIAIAIFVNVDVKHTADQLSAGAVSSVWSTGSHTMPGGERSLVPTHSDCMPAPTTGLLSPRYLLVPVLASVHWSETTTQTTNTAYDT